MSGIILVLKESEKGPLWDDLFFRMKEKGIAFEQLGAVPQIVLLPQETKEDFVYREHPAIEAIDVDDPEGFKGAETMEIAPYPVFGSWPRLRHVHRDPPWPVRGLRLPWTGEFECARTGVGVDIYIVDTGISPSHQEFSGRAERLDSFVPVHGHGTQCASCAAGISVGYAVDAKIFMAAGLRNENNTGSSSDILNALNACLTRYNARAPLQRPGVLSLSIVTNGGGAAWASVIASAIDAGMLVCACAGNDRLDVASLNIQPAKENGVIMVGGINMGDDPYNTGDFGTNYGVDVDILAGAQSVRIANYTSDSAYVTGNGTSYAAPYVAGALACMLQGYLRPTSRGESNAVQEYLLRQATYGRYHHDPAFHPIMGNAPAILYLDPGPGPYPPIPGLTPGTPSEA